MAYTTPTVADFKAQFTRDFPYGAAANQVNDSDISAAIIEAGVNFTQSLWGSQQEYSLAYLLMTAHMMVMALRGSSQGIAGQYEWLVSSKGVGSVSEGLSIPQKILDNPRFAMLTKTTYGARYLQLVLPRMIGQVFTEFGNTKA